MREAIQSFVQHTTPVDHAIGAGSFLFLQTVPVQLIDFAAKAGAVCLNLGASVIVAVVSRMLYDYIADKRKKG